MRERNPNDPAFVISIKQRMGLGQSNISMQNHALPFAKAPREAGFIPEKG